MPALKPDHIAPSPEEDAAITAAALADDDAPPLTDEDFGTFRPYREQYPARLSRAWGAKREALEPATR